MQATHTRRVRNAAPSTLGRQSTPGVPAARRTAKGHCARAWVWRGCGCGRRLVTGSCVMRETTQIGCPWSRPRVSLSIHLSIWVWRVGPGEHVSRVVAGPAAVATCITIGACMSTVATPCLLMMARAWSCRHTTRVWSTQASTRGRAARPRFGRRGARVSRCVDVLRRRRGQRRAWVLSAQR